MTTPEFKPYGKTPRWGSDLFCHVTEKIDGTNALVCLTEAGELFAGSRNRWITPGKSTDNYGFAQWCQDNREELMGLGVGYHYGEWWGSGIGRGYGAEKRTLSLFDTLRWGAHNPPPACCSVVPVLYSGKFTGVEPERALDELRVGGSVAQPGFKRVEGVIVRLGRDKVYKLLAEHHDKHKWEVAG